MRRIVQLCGVVVIAWSLVLAFRVASQLLAGEVSAEMGGLRLFVLFFGGGGLGILLMLFGPQKVLKHFTSGGLYRMARYRRDSRSFADRIHAEEDET